MKINFPKDFQWGVATAAAQIEGAALEDGKGLSIWDVFSRIPGKTKHGDTPDAGCDHYHRYREDVALMKSLGLNSYRFSFSWPRILPDGVGKVNEKGLDFYSRLIDELLEQGISPNATLYHWDLPQELENMGGWLNRDCADWFADYAQTVFRKFGDRVPMFTTVNEPISVYVGYALGWFAPGKKLEKFGRQANHNILLAHGKAVSAFRSLHFDGRIGIVCDMWHRQPARPDHAEDLAMAKRENESSYLSYLLPVFKGKYSDYLLEQMDREGSMPQMQPEDFLLIGQKLDYFGLNCYNRVVVSAEDGGAEESIRASGGNFLDNGLEFYPKSIYDALLILRDEIGVGVPIYITENGSHSFTEAPDRDGRVRDPQRIAYLKGFLSNIHRAIEEGVDVRGYYLWTLMDNFEWSSGYSQRYGIVYNDQKTQKRTLKDSAYWYANVAKNNGFGEEDE